MLFKPFDYNPNSVSVKTGSYSIPAGRYALIEAEVRNGGTFSIDGSVALKSVSTLIQASATGNATVFTCAAGRTAEVSVYGRFNAGTGNIVYRQSAGQTIDLSPAGGSNDIHESNIKMAGGDTIELVQTGAPVDGYVTGKYTDDDCNPVVATFWVPTGTSLTLAGDARYTVTEYIIPT